MWRFLDQNENEIQINGMTFQISFVCCFFVDGVATGALYDSRILFQIFRIACFQYIRAS